MTLEDALLMFDHRDEYAEAHIIDQYLPETDLPILAYNFCGGYPYDVEEAQSWVKRTFGESFFLLDLGALNLEKPEYLIPLIEESRVLLTIDTLTLHLGHGTKTPTVCLSQDGMLEPRPHWIHHCSYSEFLTPGHRYTIANILGEVVSK
jgi:hypothetical protein